MTRGQGPPLPTVRPECTYQPDVAQLLPLLSAPGVPPSSSSRPLAHAALPRCQPRVVTSRWCQSDQQGTVGAPPLETSLGTLTSAMHSQRGLRDTGRLQHGKIWAEGTPGPLPPLQCTGPAQAGPTSPAVTLPGLLSTPPTSFASGTHWCLPAFVSPRGFAASPVYAHPGQHCPPTDSGSATSMPAAPLSTAVGAGHTPLPQPEPGASSPLQPGNTTTTKCTSLSCESQCLFQNKAKRR